MICVYEAASGLDAHMILNLLEQQNIPGRIEGEYLQGGIGELQAMGFVRVVVTESDYPRSKQIIAAWEATLPPEDEPQTGVYASGGIGVFLAGVIVGATLMYWLLAYMTH